MSYLVTSDHVEPLHDGRMVGPGDVVSDADAKKNSKLIERGVLEKEPDRRKQRAQTEADGTVEPEPAQKGEKEESK